VGGWWGGHTFFVPAKACLIIIFVSFSSNDAPFGEYGVSNVSLTAVTSGQLISRTLSFDITRSGGNLGTTQVTVNITYDQVKELY
jgi:hypothetical protein